MMRDVYKNPMFYYLVVPVLLSLWPLLVWAKYLPTAKTGLDRDQEEFVDAKTLIIEILTLDPEILDVDAGKGTKVGKFTYPDAVVRAANLCNIPSGKYDYSSGGMGDSGGKKIQRARVELKDVSIVQAASFLSRILSSWVNLTCEGIKLTKKEGMPDQWDITMKFKYDY